MRYNCLQVKFVRCFGMFLEIPVIQGKIPLPNDMECIFAGVSEMVDQEKFVLQQKDFLFYKSSVKFRI